MAKGKLIFTHVIQDSQDFGGDDEHMVSRVFFNLESKGGTLQGLHSDIKQTVGTDYTSAPLEVSYPEAIRGLLSYAIFRENVERYYRDSFGPSGRAFSFGRGANIRMRHNIVQMVKVVDIDIKDGRETQGW